MRQSEEASLQKDARRDETLVSGFCVCWLQSTCFVLISDGTLELQGGLCASLGRAGGLTCGSSSSFVP